jgi:hypothetical protein
MSPPEGGRYRGSEGFANVEGAIGVLIFTSLSWSVDRPSNQVAEMRNGIFTPDTSRWSA